MLVGVGVPVSGYKSSRPEQTEPLTVSVQQRVADVLNLPAETQEHVQMLRYEPGQYYRVHHDWIHEHEVGAGLRPLAVLTPTPLTSFASPDRTAPTGIAHSPSVRVFSLPPA